MQHKRLNTCTWFHETTFATVENRLFRGRRFSHEIHPNTIRWAPLQCWSKRCTIFVGVILKALCKKCSCLIVSMARGGETNVNLQSMKYSLTVWRYLSNTFGTNWTVACGSRTMTTSSNLQRKCRINSVMERCYDSGEEDYWASPLNPKGSHGKEPKVTQSRKWFLAVRRFLK